jgi:hypothetical protein
MEDAMVERPAAGPLSERVAECLRSRVIGVRASGEVRTELHALSPELAARFWGMMGRGTRHDEAAIVALVAQVKLLEPERPAPAEPGTWTDITAAR